MRYLLSVLLGLIYASAVYPNSMQRSQIFDRFNKRGSSVFDETFSKYADAERVLRCENPRESLRQAVVSSMNKRIPGGTASRWSDFPWSVMLRKGENQFKCGGVLVGHKYVLTSAHCLAPECPLPVPDSRGNNCRDQSGWLCLENQNYQIVYGKDQYTTKETQIFIRQVTRAWIPRTYKSKNKNVYIDDVTVLRLESPFPDHFSTCFLSTRATLENFDNCIGIGYGKSDETSSAGVKLQSILAEKVSCEKHHDPNNHICFASKSKDRMNAVSCLGDSGSPVVCRDSLSSGYIVAGIYSTKTGKSCPGDGTLSALLNANGGLGSRSVAGYVGFIEGVASNDAKSSSCQTPRTKRMRNDCRYSDFKTTLQCLMLANRDI